MSRFWNVSLGTPGLRLASVAYNDETTQEISYYKTENWNTALWNTGEAMWHRSGWGGSLGMSASQIYDSASQIWDWVTYETSMGSGAYVRKVVSGNVLDSSSNPVSGATVQLYNTATGLLVDTTTSASDGSYRLGDPNAVSNFVNAYLSGSPDTAGTTVDTLSGT